MDKINCDPRRMSNKRKYDEFILEKDSMQKKRNMNTIEETFNLNKNKCINNIDLQHTNMLHTKMQHINLQHTNKEYNGEEYNGEDYYSNLNSDYDSNKFNTAINPFYFNRNHPNINHLNMNHPNINHPNMNQFNSNYINTNQFNESIAYYINSNKVLNNVITKQNNEIDFLKSEQHKLKLAEEKIKELYSKNLKLEEKEKQYEITRNNYNKDFSFIKSRFIAMLMKFENIFKTTPSLSHITQEENIIITGRMCGYNYDRKKKIINGTQVIVSMNVKENLYVYNQFLLINNSNIGINTYLKDWDKVRVFCPRRISFINNLKIGDEVRVKIFTNTKYGKLHSTIGQIIH